MHFGSKLLVSSGEDTLVVLREEGKHLLPKRSVLF
jgi:hypothetical protein